MRGPDDVEAATLFCQARGWGDGLPIVPPTLERVERMLAYCDRPWDEPVAAMPPRYGAVTPRRLAANAVMAGCRPEYFPVLLLAVATMCDEPLDLAGIQTTTHPGTPLVIVNGPGAREIDVNGGHNAFGPGWMANATIGRAIRLALLNIGGALPGLGDMATMGGPAKYSFVVARLHSALARALADTGVREALLKSAVEVPRDDTPEKFQAFVESEVARYHRLVKDGHLKAQ